LLGAYFTFPANLLIYGVNDIFDYETDKHNPKKEAYETLVKPKEQKQLWRWIAITNAPFLLLLPFLGNNGRWGIAGFLFFSVFYSMPPIRAKVRPLIDSIFNVLYIFPGIVGYAVVTKTMPSLYLCLAAAFWCMAMHAYSAVPDIQADKKAKISTIATQLGKAGTLLFCLVCYGLAAGLSISTLGQFSIAAGVLYGFMMIITLQAKNAKAVMKLYSLFPYINMSVGMALFFWILLVVK
jgi:lycopene elongase/hydratase (dihydrobisanhydrobacterioruberin-forming)